MPSDILGSIDPNPHSIGVIGIFPLRTLIILGFWSIPFNIFPAIWYIKSMRAYLKHIGHPSREKRTFDVNPWIVYPFWITIFILPLALFLAAYGAAFVSLIPLLITFSDVYGITYDISNLGTIVVLPPPSTRYSQRRKLTTSRHHTPSSKSIKRGRKLPCLHTTLPGTSSRVPGNSTLIVGTPNNLISHPSFTRPSRASRITRQAGFYKETAYIIWIQLIRLRL